MEQDYEIYKVQNDTFKDDIIAKIIKLLYQCEDISLLDLVNKLLEKSV